MTDKSAHNDTLRSFYKHIFIDYKKLIYALSSHDYAAVCSTAHRMKGSCRIVGASALASGLVDLEIATEIREQNRMDSAKQKIEEAFAMLDAYLVEIGVISNRKEDDYEH